MVLFPVLYKVALCFESVNCGMIIQMTCSCSGIAYNALEGFPKPFTSMDEIVLPFKRGKLFAMLHKFPSQHRKHSRKSE